MSLQPGSRVGWDTPCEWLHKDITNSVKTCVSDTAIWNFIQDQPFLNTVDREMRGALGVEASHTSEAKLKRMDADVAKLKKLFDDKIGATWAQAARQNSVSNLLQGAPARVKPPWEEYEDVHNRQGEDSTAAYCRRHLSTYAFRHEWCL